MVYVGPTATFSKLVSYTRKIPLFLPSGRARFLFSTLVLTAYHLNHCRNCQEDDCDEDFKPLAAEDDEECEEAGVRSRNIQTRELSDLLHDAFKQVTLLTDFSFEHSFTQIIGVIPDEYPS